MELGAMTMSFGRWSKALALAAALLALAACGGGGSDSGNNPNSGGGGNQPKAADLTLVLSAPSINNSGSETVTATVTAVDANRNTVAGIPVALRVDSNATINVSGASTDTSGVVSGAVRIGSEKTNRAITITAVSGDITRTAVLQVVGTRLRATLLPAVLNPGEGGRVQYRLVDANDNAMTAVAITVTGPGGVQTNATTGSNGEYEYSYTAPAAAGNLELRASAGGVDSVQTVIVQAGPGVIPPVAPDSVLSASMQPSATVVPVNATGNTNNRVEVRALFMGAGNVPVRNIRVRFSEVDENGRAPGAPYGSFISGNQVIYSGANGVAASAFVPGSRASATDAVFLRACWSYSDFPSGDCPYAITTRITVNDDPLSVSVGTNELIESGASNLTYVKRFVVQVVDSAGLAKPDVLVSPVLDLLRYRKGLYRWNPAAQAWTSYSASTDPLDATEYPVVGCDNEDLNRNGIVELLNPVPTFLDWLGRPVTSEDFNNSFNLTPGRPALEPRRADVSLSIEGSNRTNNFGQIVLRLEYPRNIATWVQFNLQVGAGVAGTEGRANFEGILPAPAEVIRNENATPPFVVSPYGRFFEVPVAYPSTGTPRAFVCRNPN
jgi:hypothetical protein